MCKGLVTFGNKSNKNVNQLLFLCVTTLHID
jgi:hypothetical protein